jgi:hypothetical protein
VVVNRVSEPLSESADTSSADSGFSFFGETVPKDEAEHFDAFGNNVGDIIDGEIVDDEPKKSRLKTGHTFRPPRDDKKDTTPRSAPPALDDWQDFISRVLIRAATDFYIDAAFRDIDEEWLSDREVERIRLTEVERNRIAKPLAELAHKAKFTRKHGRSIIAAAGSVDSVIQLGMWFSRVNRIANKYRQLGLANPAQPRRAQTSRNTFTPPMRPAEETNDVSSGSSASEGNGRSHWRPNIAGEVQFPDAG